MTKRRTLTADVINPVLRILISADNGADFVITKHILGQISQDFDINWAESYEAALAALATRHFDVCILDYRLGSHSAIDVLEFARGRAEQTAFIVFTALSEGRDDNSSPQEVSSKIQNQNRLNVALLERSIRHAIHRKAFEIEQAKYLNERELLLREIEHRVKNNIMMLIHEKLYHSTQALNHIDFAEYAGELFKLLFKAHGFNSEDFTVVIKMQCQLLELSLAVPCSLILNELISNSLTHAFSQNQKEKSFHVSMRKYGSKLHLFVKDNGQAAIYDLRESTGFGLRLTRLLADQIAAQVRYVHAKGFGVHFRFSE